MKELMQYIYRFFNGYEWAATTLVIIAFGRLIYKIDRWIVRYRIENMLLEELEIKKAERTKVKRETIETEKEPSVL